MLVPVLCYSGGTIAGTISQFIGRRLTIITFVLIAGAFIPLWILPHSFGGLSAGAFWLQFGVQGAWGVIPIQLAEMSPPGFRATFPGVTYQLGNVCKASVHLSCTSCQLTNLPPPLDR
jgi:MFS transporter, SHS family, lactate transporter